MALKRHNLAFKRPAFSVMKLTPGLPIEQSYLSLILSQNCQYFLGLDFNFRLLQVQTENRLYPLCYKFYCPFDTNCCIFWTVFECCELQPLVKIYNNQHKTTKRQIKTLVLLALPYSPLWCCLNLLMIIELPILNFPLP